MPKQNCGLDFNDQQNEISLDDLVELIIDYKLDLEKNIFIKSQENNYIPLNSSRPVIDFDRGLDHVNGRTGIGFFCYFN